MTVSVDHAPAISDCYRNIGVLVSASRMGRRSIRSALTERHFWHEGDELLPKKTRLETAGPGDGCAARKKAKSFEKVLFNQRRITATITNYTLRLRTKVSGKYANDFPRPGQIPGVGLCKMDLES